MVRLMDGYHFSLKRVSLVWLQLRTTFQPREYLAACVAVGLVKMVICAVGAYVVTHLFMQFMCGTCIMQFDLGQIFESWN